MLISEIFYSIQGECVHTGVPSIFIRASLCNLKCRWGKTWCDTKYVWTTKGGLGNLGIDEIIDRVKKFPGDVSWGRHVVISGGEALIQKDCPHLIEILIKRGYYVTIETNGTVPLLLNDNINDIRDRLFLSISPKLRSSTPVGTEYEKTHEKTRINLTSLKQLTNNFSYIFKFVVNENEDLREIESLCKKLKIPTKSIYLMPQGVTVKEISESAKKIIPICLEKGYNYSDRLHIRLWGKKRGV